MDAECAFMADGCACACAIGEPHEAMVTEEQFVRDTAAVFCLADERGSVVVVDENGKLRMRVGGRIRTRTDIESERVFVLSSAEAESIAWDLLHAAAHGWAGKVWVGLGSIEVEGDGRCVDQRRCGLHPAYRQSPAIGNTACQFTTRVRRGGGVE